MTSGPGDAKTLPLIDDVEITHHEGYVELEFKGEFSHTVAMRVVDAMVAAATAAECSSILLDCRRMTGPLSVIDRFAVAEYGAQGIPRHINVGMLVREDHILPDRFFENAAVSRGVRVKLFTLADEAIGWVRGCR